MQARIVALAAVVALSGFGAAEGRSGSPQPDAPDRVDDPGQSAGKTQTGGAFVLEGEVSDEALGRYVQALREIRAMAERIRRDPSVRERYARIARGPAEAGRPGASDAGPAR
ncbi:MAG TPA: hypothetical protein VF406_06400 [Thermodesulfobacteriota bacterium]